MRRELLFGCRVVRCFADRPRSLWALFLAAAVADPDGDALLWEPDGRMGYGELRRQAEAFGHGLATLGVGHGDRVATLIGNRAEYVVAALAVWRIGAVLVPLDARLLPHEIAQLLNHSGARVLVSEPTLVTGLPDRAEIPGVAAIVLADAAPGPHHAFADLLAGEPAPEACPVGEEDVAAILYTSGTTGAPKGVALAHVNMIHSTMHFEAVWGLPRGSRSALAIPASNVTGLVTVILTMFRLGGCVVVMPPFRAVEFLRVAQKRRIDHSFLVPAQYKLLMMAPDLADHDLSSWRLGSCGGAPMPRAFVEEIMARIPGLQLSDGYGATELASPAIIRPPALTREHPESIGLPVACAEVVIVDEAGVEVSVGEPGELWIRGPMVCRGYWQDPAATDANFVDGYWKSGDIASRDGDGLVRLHDRKKDVVNRGGFKIYSAEVESVLALHQDVAEVAVVPKPDAVLGERVHAVIHRRAGSADAEALRLFCAERLAQYKVPESFTFLDAPLPRNSNGKVVKRGLRDRLFGDPAAA